MLYILNIFFHLIRFRPAAVKDLIHKVLLEYLSEKKYSSEDAPAWTREIGDNLLSQLKSVQWFNSVEKVFCIIFLTLYVSGLGLDRYKFVVQVLIGEQRGEGVK